MPLSSNFLFQTPKLYSAKKEIHCIVTYPEEFSYQSTGMGAPKNKIYLYLHYYFASQAMFLHFKPK